MQSIVGPRLFQKSLYSAAHLEGEVACALLRKWRAGNFDDDGLRHALRLFDRHMRKHFRVMPVNEAILVRSLMLLHRHRRIRFTHPDALHLAAAIEFRELGVSGLVIVASDDGLTRAGEAEGFKLFDPTRDSSSALH